MGNTDTKRRIEHALGNAMGQIDEIVSALITETYGLDRPRLLRKLHELDPSGTVLTPMSAALREKVLAEVKSGASADDIASINVGATAPKEFGDLMAKAKEAYEQGEADRKKKMEELGLTPEALAKKAEEADKQRQATEGPDTTTQAPPVPTKLPDQWEEF